MEQLSTFQDMIETFSLLHSMCSMLAVQSKVASLQIYHLYTMRKMQLTLLAMVTMLVHVHFLLRSTRAIHFQGAPPNEQLMDVVHGLEMIKCAILLHCY